MNATESCFFSVSFAIDKGIETVHFCTGMSPVFNNVVHRIEPLQISMLSAAAGERIHPYATGWHRLPGTLLEWSETGTWIVEFEDTAPAEAGPDRIVVVPCMRQHRLTMAEGPRMTTHWFIIGLEAPNGTDVLSAMVIPPVLPAAASGVLCPMLEQLREMSARSRATEMPAALALHAHVIRILQTLFEPGIGAELPTEPQYPARVERVLRMIVSNLDSPLNRRQLAREAGLSPTRFHYVFKQALGIAPMDYVHNRRHLLAQRLLLGTRLTVREIAARCGYSSAQYLSRVFRRETGRAPGEYRRLLS